MSPRGVWCGWVALRGKLLVVVDNGNVATPGMIMGYEGCWCWLRK